MAATWTLVDAHGPRRGSVRIRWSGDPRLAASNTLGACGLKMPQNEPVTTDDVRALSTLDIHYGMLLGCTGTDLRRSGWTIVTARLDFDPMALPFGQRSLVYLVMPEPRDRDQGRSGVAVIAPELRAHVAPLLRELAPDALLTPDGLRALDEILRAGKPAPLTAAAEAHSRIRYATASSFRPYVGQLVEWIEPLDEASESEPLALGLLARYNSVYVIRQNGSIASFAGIRPQSPHVAELGIRTEAASLPRRRQRRLRACGRGARLPPLRRQRHLFHAGGVRRGAAAGSVTSAANAPPLPERGRGEELRWGQFLRTTSSGSAAVSPYPRGGDPPAGPAGRS